MQVGEDCPSNRLRLKSSSSVSFLFLVSHTSSLKILCWLQNIQKLTGSNHFCCYHPGCCELLSSVSWTSTVTSNCSSWFIFAPYSQLFPPLASRVSDHVTGLLQTLQWLSTQSESRNPYDLQSLSDLAHYSLGPFLFFSPSPQPRFIGLLLFFKYTTMLPTGTVTSAVPLPKIFTHTAT